MAFIDTLKKYLIDVRQGHAQATGLNPSIFEPANARAHLIRCLERLEQQERSNRVADKTKYWQLLCRWQNGDVVVRFAQTLVQRLLEGMSKGATAQELQIQIEVAIARRLGLPDQLQSTIRTLELDRLARIVEIETLADEDTVEPHQVDTYAAAIRATRGEAALVALTPVGRVFLEITGRDAIRWLLHVEIAQSTGPADDWRLSRETARVLAEETGWEFFDGDPDPEPFPHSWVTLRRLRAFGLVSIAYSREEGVTALATLPLGRDLFQEVSSEEESPMSNLAKSLLADLTLSAAEVVSRPSNEETGARASAAEATARTARLVAHEIRNALVPVKTSLGVLYREMLLNPSSDTLTRRKEGIDRGIDAVFRFVEQLVKLSALAAKPPEPFDGLSAIRDAVALVEAESGVRIEQALPPALPPVSGHRDRVVMAVTNVLRNATQAVTGSPAAVRISAEAVDGERAVLLTVEDNGPGVPENMRQAIFNEGISLRPGGSGMGLALVREVFEREMKGLVSCDASSLGGARFLIRMPTTGVE